MFPRSAIRSAAVVALALSASGLSADWPHFLGPNHDLTSTETRLSKDFADGSPKIVWNYNKGAGHTGPVVASGKLVLFHDVGGRETVDCLDAGSGKRLWRFDYAVDYAPQFGAGPGPRTSPVIDGSRVFTLGIKGDLHCLDLGSGAVVWKRELAREYRLLPTFFGQGGTPLVLGDRLVLSLGTEDAKSVVALDKTSGKELWAAKHAWGASYSSPVPARLHGRECVLALQGAMVEPPAGGLLCIDATTGELLSATPHRATMFASVSVSAPIVVGARVFISEAYTEGGACVDIAPDFTARVRWRAPKFGTYLTTAGHRDGHLYGFAGMHQQNAELVCLEVATGKELWRDDLGRKFQRGSLLAADGAFLCLGENGDLAWLELTPGAAKVVSQAKLFHAPESWTPPALSDGRLYICQNAAGSGGTKPRVICYDLRKK